MDLNVTYYMNRKVRLIEEMNPVITVLYGIPYCSNINKNLGKEFSKLVDKHFYRKIFNKKVFKISYSCMNNTTSIISHMILFY